MTTAQLLALAGVITKDPSHAEYSDTIKYSMLTAAQEAIVTQLHHTYLRHLKREIKVSAIASPGTYSLASNFLRPVYLERNSDGVEVEFMDLEEKGKLVNSIEGGTDTRPKWIMYENDADTLTGRILVDTYAFTGTQWYIKRPPTISVSQEPVIVGFDNLILMYFKYMYHLIEGQVELAALAKKSFDDEINSLNEARRS